MSQLFPDDQMPPPGEKVTWEVQIRGTVTWTIEVDAITPEEAVAVACDRVEKDPNLEPDDAPEPDYDDADVMGWERIKPEKPEAA